MFLKEKLRVWPKRNRNRSDSVVWQMPLHHRQIQNATWQHKNVTKTSITQRLRTDLGLKNIPNVIRSLFYLVFHIYICIISNNISFNYHMNLTGMLLSSKEVVRVNSGKLQSDCADLACRLAQTWIFAKVGEVGIYMFPICRSDDSVPM